MLLSFGAIAQIDLRTSLPDLPENILEHKQYKRIHDLNKRRDAAGHSNMDWARWQEWEKLNVKNEKTSASNIWENFGPTTKSGRIISIAIHPTDTNIMYVGAASGGLWRTNNYGVTWNCLTDIYPTMGVGAVALNPQNPNTVLIATGEGYSFGSEFTSGFGILISYDAGQTFAFTNIVANLSSSFAGMDILWNTIDTNKVSIATSFGMYFSNDGGATSTYVLDRMPSRMVQDPQNPNNLYLFTRYYNASFPGGFYKSFDSGQSWNLVTGSGLPSLTAMGYTSVAIHPIHNNIIYANISKSALNGLGPMQGLYKSSNYGNTFTQIMTNVDIQCYHPPYTNICQGWFANTITISPSDTNLLFAGGTRFWKSPDGGYNWINADWDGVSSYYSVHPDHHQTFFHPLTGHLIDCNDGGVNYSNDLGDTWTEISDGLITHQFYNISFAETDPEFVIGGTQDVGLFTSTQSLSSGLWENPYSGDGFGTAIDHTDKNTWYATLFMNYRRIKSLNAGANWSQINSGTSTADQWRMPMVMHPVNSQILMTSNDNYMYKTTDGGVNWQQVSSFGSIGGFEFDKINPNIIYAFSLYGSTVYRSANGGNTWVQLANSPGSPITDCSADPQITGVVYATIGTFATQSQVYKSVNSGLTWSNISSNLPAIPAHTLAVDPWDSFTIYVGTDIGVWVTQNGGVSWMPFNNGLPVLVVEDLHFYKPDTTIRIGTYGRGYWKTSALSSTTSNNETAFNQNMIASVFPNPVKADNHFHVLIQNHELQGRHTTINLFNTMGQLVLFKEVRISKKAELISVQAPEFSGLYHLMVRCEKEAQVFKVVVE